MSLELCIICLYFLLKNVNKKFSVGGEAFYRIPIITAESVKVVSLYKTAEFKALLSPVPSAMAEACVLTLTGNTAAISGCTHREPVQAGRPPVKPSPRVICDSSHWPYFQTAIFAILQQQMGIEI